MLQEVDGVVIVFVSFDKSPEAMNIYMKESLGDWPAVQHNSAEANDLKQKYGTKTAETKIKTYCIICGVSKNTHLILLLLH
jgi:hypothetical protein